MEACKVHHKELPEWQAMEVLEAAICMYHTNHKETTNTEEMTRIIRKVDDGTKEIRVLLLEEDPREHKPNAKPLSLDDEDFDVHPEEEETDLFSHIVSEFEDQFWECRKELRNAGKAIGQEYPERLAEHANELHADGTQKWTEYKGPMVMTRLKTMGE